MDRNLEYFTLSDCSDAPDDLSMKPSAPMQSCTAEPIARRTWPYTTEDGTLTASRRSLLFIESSKHFAQVVILVVVLLTLLSPSCRATAHSADPFGGTTTLQQLVEPSNHQENLIEDVTLKFLSKSGTSLTQQSAVQQSSDSNVVASPENNVVDQTVHQDREKWFTEVNLANAHLFYIRTKYSCSVPRAKLVKVHEFHESPWKQYVPR